ncbi:MAG: exodeoxyribonuclease V subunit gamma [Lachnospiraceae bacterium]|nr:exodeoxyribonuclease V subunit gamma [Lachnospiraceae bacterium]
MKKGLHLICGGSGSGKSTFVYDDIIRESIANPKELYFLIVPEQVSSTVEREIIKRHPNHGVANVDILSINRLTYRVAEELNRSLKVILDDTGKSMLLRKVVYDNRPNLKVYNRMENRPGFIDQLKSVISEFYQYEIKDGDLIDLANSEELDDVLKLKLCDLITLYQGFVAEISGNYQMMEEMPDLLAELTKDSLLLKNAHFYFDDFTGFTPNQYSFLSELFKVSNDLTFTITLPKNAGIKAKSSDVFSMSRDYLDTLLKMYEKIGESEIIWLSYENHPYRQYGKPDLLALETSLFRYNNLIPDGLEVNNVKGYEATNTRAEISVVARDIRDYIDNHDLRYRDIAVVAANLEDYESLISEIFNKYEIPFYMDLSSKTANHPFVENLRAALDIALNGKSGFSIDRVYKLLGTGVSAITDAECIFLKNYLYETNTFGYNAWTKKFTRVPKWLWANEKDTKKKERKLALKANLLENVNRIRQNFVKPLIPLIKAAEKKDVKALASAIYDYTVELEFQKKIEEYANEIKDTDIYEYSRWMKVYPSILALLDKLVELTSAYKDISADEINEILSAGFDEMAVLTPPATFDQVVVGELLRSRLNNVKVLFFIGLNDSVLPMDMNSTNLLNNQDREKLKTTDLNLAPDRLNKAYQEKFYLYLMTTKASDKLVLSYSRMNSSGDSMSPCYFIREINRVLKDFKITVVDREDYLSTANNLYGAAVRDLIKLEQNSRLNDDELKELTSILKYSKDYNEDIINRINRAYKYDNQVAPISNNLVDRLFGRELVLSVSRLEQYTACPFKHFIKYGLGVGEETEYSFENVDYGNLLHRILELYGKSIKDKDIHKLTYDEHYDLCENAITTAFAELDFNFGETNRLSFQEEAIKDIAKDNLDIVAWQSKRSSFKPEEFELDFGGKNNKLLVYNENGRTVSLTGVIDRVDRFKEDDKNYLRVIDYKTGNMKFDLIKLYHGLQLQLMTYLNVLDAKNDGEVKAAYYYHIFKPVVDLNGKEEINLDVLLSRRDYYKKYTNEFKLKGFCDSNSDVINAIENKESGYFDTVSIMKKMDGTASSNSSVYSLETIRCLMNYCDDKIKEIAKNMLEGDIKISPYKYGQESSCKYCVYKDICQITANSNCYRKLNKVGLDDLVSKVKKDNNGLGEGDENE